MKLNHAQNVVMIEAAAIAGIATLGTIATKDKLPPVSAYVAAGLLGTGLMVLAKADGETAIALGGLCVAGAALTQYKGGLSLAEAALTQIGKIGKGTPATPGESSQSAWDKLSTSTGSSDALGPQGPTALGGKDGSAIPGSPVPGLQPHAATHQTGNLPGYPAYDYMAPAGTTVVAPVDGTIFRLSGKDPALGGPPGGALGYSIYLNGTNGKSYFLTHLDKVSVRAGQTVQQGQPIAVVANGPSSWSSPHVHMGVHG